MERAAGDPRGIGQALQHVRELPKRATDLGPPRFRLTGLAVGDGLTDPATQVAVNQSISELVRRWGAVLLPFHMCHLYRQSCHERPPSLQGCAGRFQHGTALPGPGHVLRQGTLLPECPPGLQEHEGGDACMQVLQHADTAFYMGMIDMNQRIQVSVMQLRAAQLIFEGVPLQLP